MSYAVVFVALTLAALPHLSERVCAFLSIGLAPVCGFSALLPEDGAALVTHDGLTVERWNVTGATAELTWSVRLPAYPVRAHADTTNPGRYLVAPGYAGDRTLP